ncbi:MAG TPA: hypothetical protein VGM76_19540 [Lacipirellulaceae bacterium]|jgi:hypothetical protein
MELDPAELNRQIGKLEIESNRLGIERAALAKAAGGAARRYRYLQFARHLRRPAASSHLWPLAVLLVGPLILGILMVILFGLIFSSTSILITTFIVGALAGAALIAALLYYPGDAVLAAELPDAEAKWQFERNHLEEVVRQVAEANQQLQKHLDERRQLAASDKLQRAMLLQRNWKEMRGVEWEDFLVEVCRTLGAHVERVANSAYVPPGSAKPVAAGRKTIVSPANHLIVTLSPRRIAVAPIAGINPFHPAAVQQTLNELAQHGCDTTAIIINTRVTAGSRELATHRNCTLIGEDEFPDFVLGKLTP